MPDASQLFDTWASAGRGESMARGHWPMVAQILSRMELGPRMACLDVGCGNGYAVRAMAERVMPAGRAVGVDVSAGMIEVAQAHPHNPPHVDYRLTAPSELPFDAETFDRVLSVEAVYYMPDPLAALKEWYRVLKPGGSIWVMVDFYQENPYSATWDSLIDIPMHYLSEKQYRELLEKAGFTAVFSDRLFNLMPLDLDYITNFKPGWGYESINDVRRFRTEIGSLLVSGKKSSLDIPDPE
jgi:ubiquinone/menaquinone biosynthesis C-methylase UbiE